jgi:hypothetical protein
MSILFNIGCSTKAKVPSVLFVPLFLFLLLSKCLGWGYSSNLRLACVPFLQGSTIWHARPIWQSRFFWFAYGGMPRIKKKSIYTFFYKFAKYHLKFVKF